MFVRRFELLRFGTEAESGLISKLSYRFSKKLTPHFRKRKPKVQGFQIRQGFLSFPRNFGRIPFWN